MNLPHVLSRGGNPVTFDLERYRADQLKKAARFWIGAEAYKLPKAACLEALQKVFRNRPEMHKGFTEMSKAQQQILAVFARYGPKVSGPVLSAELHSRGLGRKREAGQYYRRDDVVDDLCEKFVLLRSDDAYSYYSSSLYYDRYPDLMLHPAVATALTPIAPVPWQPSGDSPLTMQNSYQRSATAVALELWQVANGLQNLGSWQTVKGGSMAKSSRNRLHKAVSLVAADKDPMLPPDPDALYYEILRGIGCLTPLDAPQYVRLSVLEQHVQQPVAAQAWQWVRAWLGTRLWQDGIGLVPDRDSDHDPVRINLHSLSKARELLLWALCRVAHSPDIWLDVETFLRDLWQATSRDQISFYWGSYTWSMAIEMARKRDSFPSGDQRMLAFWLSDEGIWIANVILVTFVALGLVQRGQSAGKTSRWHFRLTPLGRIVFGAPDVAVPTLAASPKPFMTVQPNLEVVAYLDQADASQICTLARFTAHSPIPGSQVQTFTLQRAAVYQALESGLMLADIETFLRTQSNTGLPDNVARTLSEWAGKRESLVLRTKVTLVCGPNLAPGNQGTLLRDGMLLLPTLSRAQAAKSYPRYAVLDHRSELSRVCTATELGDIRSKNLDSIGHTRLAYLAERTPQGWEVSAASVTRARQRGLPAEQMLGWLRAHLSHPLPPVLEMAIRNWTGNASVFAGPVQLLHVTRMPARDAILHSPLFAALLAGHIPPDWFVVRDDKIPEVTQLLQQLGFTVGDACPVAALTKLGVSGEA